MGILFFIALLAVSLCLGGMAFFSFCVAPLTFSRLPPEHAKTFIRAIFPLYYLYIIGTAIAAAIALMPMSGMASALMAGVAFVAFWLRQALTPRINALRDQSEAGDANAERRFRRLHKASVIANLIQIGTTIAVLGGF
ncbi:DUF4149 domain-containing protein [Rhodovarius crocodyli]|uniref:DUF4149 domain-containing protein n=1 Tax=Rhodovarius crocodyli TaxID=1979269 RepID=A0A437MMC3_9PROT|nr:DUF4149 domain-containing protein [Rhodovarius crocodyli]RVT98783.1 DUF4149 domain-containing protein [Rhodovarius crocodyli]